MSSSPSSEPEKPIPVARAARRRAIPAVEVAEGDEAGDGRSPWELTGWAWSLVVHGLVLLALGLWYFAPPRSQVRTFDTRLAGSEMGVDAGLTALGGLDTPVALPDMVVPVETSPTLERIKPADMDHFPIAGAASAIANPGAGGGEGFGLAKFGSGGESVRGVEVKVGDPQFTLIWDSNADIDLHVIEPGGKEIYWNDTKGRFGGELDVDNVEGFGPENIYWLKQAADGSRELGPGPAGEYQWFVNYYGGNRGIPVATRWRVRIKHAGRVEVVQGRLTVPKARSRTYTLKVEGTPPTPPVGTMPAFDRPDPAPR